MIELEIWKVRRGALRPGLVACTFVLWLRSGQAPCDVCLDLRVAGIWEVSKLQGTGLQFWTRILPVKVRLVGLCRYYSYYRLQKSYAIPRLLRQRARCKASHVASHPTLG